MHKKNDARIIAAGIIFNVKGYLISIFSNHRFVFAL